MDNNLIIWLPASEMEPVFWLTRSEQGQLSVSNLLTQQLGKLAEQLPGRKVTVLVPGEAVTLHSLEQAGKINSAVYQSLRWRLEDDIAEDVEQLHIAVLEQADGIAHLASVSQARMEQWQSWLAGAEIESNQWLPDTLALPWNEGEISIFHKEKKSLVRSGQYTTAVCEESWMPLYLRSIDSDELAHKELSVDSVFEVASRSSLNLLQGSWQPRSKTMLQVRVWRRAAVLAVLSLTLFLGQSITLNTRLEAQNQTLQQQAKDIYQQLFPGERIVRLESQLKQKLASLQGSKQTEVVTMPLLLEQLAPAFTSVPAFQTMDMEYNLSREELRITAQSVDFESFERFRESAPTSLQVTIESTEQQNKLVKGTVIVKASTEGAAS
ncbi:type II secretion system protein GspL [Parendozoicomonas haliclonae]|uniref:Type II secretion system protein L n=1 Tax=Parendozoicomonas haliclonae TaxID=1960125 RepID=A0A1X7AGN5_9GAMM|nr:type II secretion system protein GspL [Parendozoicomonas haliclonae]SMA39512.1 Type II secretion system protein L [Parendozoicomonas haliclonae]